jgi:hypothetical protein
MSAFISFFYLGIFQLSLLQPDLYYDLVIAPENFIPSGLYGTPASRLQAVHPGSGFNAGLYLPNYRRCFENQDPASCLNTLDYRPQLEMGSDKWKLGAKIDLDEIKLRLKIPLR